MYSLHHLTQSNTVRKELPAGLLPPRQLGFCPRSGSHWYNHKYNCLASLPAACTLGYPGIPESFLSHFSLMDVKKHGSGSVGVIRHMNFPFCQFPDQPGIYCSKEKFPILRTLSGTFYMIQDPFQFRSGKIGVRNQTGFFRTNSDMPSFSIFSIISAVLRHCHTIAG